MNAVLPFSAVAQVAQYQEISCDDPYHNHRSPVQYMFAVQYRGHHVALTIDGDCYSVRIDRNPRTDQHDMSRAQAFAYVERMTK
jgi:hypothetical protein